MLLDAIDSHASPRHGIGNAKSEYSVVVPCIFGAKSND